MHKHEHVRNQLREMLSVPLGASFVSRIEALLKALPEDERAIWRLLGDFDTGYFAQPHLFSKAGPAFLEVVGHVTGDKFAVWPEFPWSEDNEFSGMSLYSHEDESQRAFRHWGDAVHQRLLFQRSGDLDRPMTDAVIVPCSVPITELALALPLELFDGRSSGGRRATYQGVMRAVDGIGWCIVRLGGREMPVFWLLMSSEQAPQCALIARELSQMGSWVSDVRIKNGTAVMQNLSVG
jgi:hypothetical protein